MGALEEYGVVCRRLARNEREIVGGRKDWS